MPGSILGNEVRRTEDPRLLIGAGKYVDDLQLDGTARAVFVRSPVAHAKVTRIDTSEAAKMPGVLGVFTNADIGLGPIMFLPLFPPAFARPVLADGVVRYVGEQVAVVVAETARQAADAAEAVVVDYDPLPAVVDAEKAAAEEGTKLFPDAGTNVCFAMELGRDDSLMADADVVVSRRIINQRVAPAPMESNGCVALPDPEVDGGLILYASTQAPHAAQAGIAGAIGLDASKLRVIAPAVGGGFGAKGGPAHEWVAACVLAKRLNRPVVWFESRSENMTNMVHGRAMIQDVELGAKKDGTLVAFRGHAFQDSGAYPFFGPVLPTMTRQMASGVYSIPKVEFNFSATVTNTTPISAYRGAGRPEAAAQLERAMDMLSVELGIDPVELRRKNLLPKDAFPHTTPTGANYDVGDYHRALDEAVRIAGYEQLRVEQKKRRDSGDRKQLGIGVSVYVEVTAGVGPSEFGSVEIHPDGNVTVRTGTAPHGQGHETAWAQIVADTLGVPIESVKVVHSDTKLVPKGEGTMGSRSAQIGGSAVLRASEAIVTKAKDLAAHLLEAAAEDITIFDDGKVGVAGSPQSGLTWAELATAANDSSKRPDGWDGGLDAIAEFVQAGPTFPFGAHISVVEVDTETGYVKLLRHIAVDDCGKIINPMLVRGQVHGGVGQGIAQALYEEFLYDEDGNPLTSTFATYAFPSAAELISYETSNPETPTPLNPLGAKGIGESGTIGSTPAVQNAVVDAVSHLGVKHIDMPLSPERVWRAIQAARGA
jgi:carbon-monoxide dehydrogenase large subunit